MSLFLMAAPLPVKAFANKSSTDISGALIQGYSADPSVLPGMFVQQQDKNRMLVVPLTDKDSSNMLGVVVSSNSAALTLTPQTSGNTQPVLVAPSGEYMVLASTQAGAIKPGDFLTMSSLAGIAMKASKDQENVVGRADTAFNGSNALETATISVKGGKPQTVSIGDINVEVRLAPNPAFHSSNTLPGIVTKTADNIAQQSVPLIQVYLSLAILILTFFISGILFYGAVRSSLISIGRNPLSKKSVVLGLIKVLVVGLLILGAGIVGSYLVLKF